MSLDTNTNNKCLVGLPYIEGITEKILRILKSNNIFVYTFSVKIVKQILHLPKDPVDHFRRAGAIYSIPCLNCNHVYIGETGRCFETRL